MKTEGYHTRRLDERAKVSVLVHPAQIPPHTMSSWRTLAFQALCKNDTDVAQDAHKRHDEEVTSNIVPAARRKAMQRWDCNDLKSGGGKG